MNKQSEVKAARVPVGRVLVAVVLGLLGVPSCFVTAHLSQAAGSVAADVGVIGWVGLPIAILFGALVPAIGAWSGAKARRPYMSTGGQEALEASTRRDGGNVGVLSLLFANGRRQLTLIWFTTLAAGLVAIAAAVAAGAMFVRGMSV